MISPHYKQTQRRIESSDAKYILAIQDQMRLNFTSHKAKTELGLIGKNGKTDQYGLIQHSVLCVTDQNEPLGLIDVDYFDYSDFDVSVDRKNRILEDKTNIFWLQGLKNMKKRLRGTQKKIITVADREGDFYDFLYELTEANEAFVIRSKHNRMIGEIYKRRGKKLRELLGGTAIKGHMKVTIQEVNSREIKEMTLHLKAAQIIIPIPKNITVEQKKSNVYKPIKLNVAVAYNEQHEWILFTNLPIETIDQIKEIVEIYKARWHIEDYHKVLKTGYRVDEIYLHHSKETIKNLLVMSGVVA